MDCAAAEWIDGPVKPAEEVGIEEMLEIALFQGGAAHFVAMASDAGFTADEVLNLVASEEFVGYSVAQEAAGIIRSGQYGRHADGRLRCLAYVVL